ncbi:WhiB family transcriptional regulator [Actinosynnema sp. NPDC020468]|uniref:WhiB family transcriptional regulator n=1 Tax=Actinosynnema sp. NPDC020468 TaxID=3154488 RepID=UPI0033D25201
MNGLQPQHEGHRTLMIALFGGLGEPPEWRDQAACKDTDPRLFFSYSKEQEAAEICAACPVLHTCRADQLDWEARGAGNNRYRAAGVVGGLTGRERQLLHAPPGRQAS